MICNNSQCFVKKDTVFSPHDLAFLLIKSKKNYKAKFFTKTKFLTSSILKKKLTKTILEKKITIIICSVLDMSLQCIRYK
jgi:hypothetical protein